MANTFHRINIQFVFSVKNRHSLIKEKSRDKIEKYICSIVSNHNCKPIAIYCNPDHVHLLVGLRPAMCISNLMKEIKVSSSKFIKSNINGNNYFEWQEGYGVFSYSNSQIPLVAKYILNQKKHHSKYSFREEYRNMLEKVNINFEDHYLFDFIDLEDR